MDDKNIKLSPWNLNNKLLTLDDIYNIYEKAGFTNALNIIKINDINLYQTAFIHTSYTKNNCENDFKNKPRNVIDLFDEDYENMEFLGDRCLDLSIAFYLHRMYPTMDQGFKTKMKTKLVKKDTLAKFARFLGFSDLIIISKHIEEKTNENHKETLLQYYQKEFKITPKYLELSIEGPPHNRIFTMGVLDKNGDIISRGVAKSKKEAEQQASLNALKYFGENTNILYDSDN